MKSFILLAFIFTVAFTAYSQPVPFREVTTLPEILEESSGLEITEGSFWSLNDSGGEKELYHFDSTGTLFRSLRLANSLNRDWEDLAQDDTGNFYIGDFGNNDNDRKNLRVYKLPNPLPISTNITNAEIIEFAYEDQQDFPPGKPLRHFDMEAMIWYQGALYLFSKNRTEPFDGMVHLYKLADTPGQHTAMLIDSFYTGAGTMLDNWVTSADISPDGRNLILLGQGKAWLFQDFEGDAFFEGTVRVLQFPSLTQKEAICFASNTRAYITDELVGGIFGGRLYEISIDDLVYVPSIPNEGSLDIRAYPNPFQDDVTVKFSTQPTFASVDVYDSLGRLVLSRDDIYKQQVQLSLAGQPSGIYHAVISQKERAVTTVRLVHT
ncbi:MAG: hypothetical protein CL946_10710, partial [Ectothiorhodospiraceae bacterium]|nr:hypothetical protein [Ectothiorhodospiraceae bacterium]